MKIFTKKEFDSIKEWRESHLGCCHCTKQDNCEKIPCMKVGNIEIRDQYVFRNCDEFEPDFSDQSFTYEGHYEKTVFGWEVVPHYYNEQKNLWDLVPDKYKVEYDELRAKNEKRS